MKNKKAQVKNLRQQQLIKYLQESPFFTDKDLASLLNVSVPTIRLDRLEMGIPELRVRTKEVAEKHYSRIKSLDAGELIGELVEIDIGKRGISFLEVKKEMVFARTKVMRGHYLFAQANSLAVALVSADVALTGSARVRFQKPVSLGQRVIACAEVVAAKGGSFLIKIRSQVENTDVFVGQFIIVAKELKDFEDSC